MNTNIYEINTRVWLRSFDEGGKRAKLTDVPDEFIDYLKNMGFDYLWLMGIWKTPEGVVEKYCLEENLVYNYRQALKDWRKEDVIGSPYSIDSYEINPEIGDQESLLNLKSRLNKKGIKLILDFVPNHFSAKSILIRESPFLFLATDLKYFENDPHTYFQPNEDKPNYFAHGRDPFFPAWQDTIQVNYFSTLAREYMIKVLLNLTKLCDGVRCDMAMLALNNIFRNTWGGVLKSAGFEKPKDEFWKIAIEIIKDFRKDFLFIAEAYWDLEWELQQLGFDFTYDKKLTDRLESGIIPQIKDHLLADSEYQNRSIRFLENHDEVRAISKFGKEKSQAAAIIVSSIRGMHLFYEGQFEGKRIKLPLQLGREPVEFTNNSITEFYTNLLEIISQETFRLWRLGTP